MEQLLSNETANMFAQFMQCVITDVCRAAYEQARKDAAEDYERNSIKNYTRAELAERLGVSLVTLHQLVKQGIIKPIKIGRKVLFERAAIEKALECGELRRYKKAK